MKKKIAILGSTGSIGKTLLKVVNKNKTKFEILLLTAQKDHLNLIKQAKKFKVKNLIITNSKSYKILKKKEKKLNINVYNNFENLNKIFNKKIDYVMNSIVGFSGLQPTLNIIKFTKEIAIANKESIICGWNLILKLSSQNNTKILPVDSEHFSLWSLIDNKKTNYNLNFNKNIKSVVLTASGGPFLNKSNDYIKNVSVSKATKHPTWKMGKKISIDSATLVNKVFEVIEAQRLFEIDLDKIFIKIHQQSYIHSIVNLTNGLIKICAYKPDMFIPIYNTLNLNKEIDFENKINFKILNNLNFINVDKKKFPVVKILKNYPKSCTLYDTALVSINDELVNLFLSKKISFNDISDKLIKILNLKSIKRLKKIIPKNYSDIRDINEFVRLKTVKLCIC